MTDRTRTELKMKTISGYDYFFIPSWVKWKCSCGFSLFLEVGYYECHPRLGMSWIPDGVVACEHCGKRTPVRVWFSKLQGTTKPCPTCKGLGKVYTTRPNRANRAKCPNN